ncbi:DUF3592 domain-containing protein [Thorsellia kenyensis]|uniref:DUF3592 domain-containing protein n=1 Tax=Thorsellia kenyensis TaxID=1549888 RepID=A0ABV6CF50_9GAMM
MRGVILLFKIIFFSVAMILLISAAILAKKNYDFIQTSQLTTGIVSSSIPQKSSSGEILYAPVITFIDSSGKEHNVIGSTLTKTLLDPIGSTVEIYYDQNSPNEAIINNISQMWIGVIILCIIGVGFLFFVAIFFVIFKKPNADKFKREGFPVKALITEIGPYTLISINHRTPYRITAQWLDKLNNTVHIFDSEFIWYDPSPYIENNEITIYIMRNNPKKYYVDISFLPEKG